MRPGAHLSPGTVVPANSTLSLMHGTSAFGAPSQCEWFETDVEFEVPETVNGYWYRLDALPTAAS